MCGERKRGGREKRNMRPSHWLRRMTIPMASVLEVNAHRDQAIRLWGLKYSGEFRVAWSFHEALLVYVSAFRRPSQMMDNQPTYLTLPCP